ncbi:MAG: hypothetical protein JWP65_1749 [Ramlibacter sp.]|jgi:hypothetical protein|uniref:hypothetical protein n=1 Tax=Ramlibacter sp. TaxID=1917967 RepID=UPI002619A1CE|nr:hypothetical protein [Ramlibacter sp.]MDB5751328.1 hypothetical protein [Ramlibacter sp.]
MKSPYLLLSFLVFAFSADAMAQAPIWRCGNTYTNEEIKGQACKLVEGGNVTVVQGTKVNGAAAQSGPREVKVGSAPQTVSAPGQRVDSTEQRARDGEARTILEAELKKAEARHAELLKEFNNGQPDKLGPETKNYQKYLDRVADLKASIERNERDIAGIKRELGRSNNAAAVAK